MRGVVLACVLGGSLGAAACLLTLDAEIACGDGFTDTRAGEECDPADRDSFGRSACGGQIGGCNPLTCELQCCGDGVVNNDEECDGNDLGLVIPGGDPTQSNNCRMLTVPGTSVPYASGSARCNDQCRFDRTDCSLCGNDLVDPQFVNPDGTVLPAEICDGERFDLQALSSACAPLCGQPSGANIGCNVTCNGCRLLTVEEPINCCTPTNMPLGPTSPPCCCHFHERGCELPFTETADGTGGSGSTGDTEGTGDTGDPPDTGDTEGVVLCPDVASR